MLLSLSEKSDRRYKNRGNERQEGITCGIALQARGFVSKKLGPELLKKDNFWFGNDAVDTKKAKKDQKAFLLLDMCKRTWTYGDKVAQIIKSLMGEIGLGCMPDTAFYKQIGYTIVPKNVYVKNLYYSKTAESEDKKKKKKGKA